MIRVLLVIDIPFYREGLAVLLSRSADVVIAGSAPDADSAARMVSSCEPDVILVDTSAADAQSLCRLESAPPVVALAVGETPESVASWAAAGAIGYVSRSAGLADLLQCLQSAARGEVYCSPRVTAILLHRYVAQPATPLPRSGDLTAREREILDLVGRGLCNKVIATRLNISHATAKKHVHHILDKLQLRSRAEAAAYLHAQPESTLAAPRIRT